MNETHNITLNLPCDLTEAEWGIVEDVYRSIDGYIVPSDGDCPCWYGAEGSSRYICVSVEPSGLVCSGVVDSTLWAGWLTLLCARLTINLGREVRDAEM